MSPFRRVLAALMIAAATTAGADEPVPPTLVMPLPDAERGRQVFGAKGCVVCHAVNGVGGNAGPARIAAPRKSSSWFWKIPARRLPG